MKLNELHPSKYLSAEDLDEGQDLIVTIKGVTKETMKTKAGAEESKPVLSFTNGKPMVLNLTNAKTIAKLHGDETDDWTGKAIALFTTEVESFGEMVLALRVRARLPQAGGGAPRPSAAAPQYETLNLDDYSGPELGGLYEWMAANQPSHPQRAELEGRLGIGKAPKAGAPRPSARAASEPYGADEPSYEDFEGAGLPLQ